MAVAGSIKHSHRDLLAEENAPFLLVVLLSFGSGTHRHTPPSAKDPQAQDSLLHPTKILSLEPAVLKRNCSALASGYRLLAGWGKGVFPDYTARVRKPCQSTGNSKTGVPGVRDVEGQQTTLQRLERGREAVWRAGLKFQFRNRGFLPAKHRARLYCTGDRGERERQVGERKERRWRRNEEREKKGSGTGGKRMVAGEGGRWEEVHSPLALPEARLSKEDPLRVSISCPHSVPCKHTAEKIGGCPPGEKEASLTKSQGEKKWLTGKPYNSNFTGQF